jgi:hypothetical protein
LRGKGADRRDDAGIVHQQRLAGVGQELAQGDARQPGLQGGRIGHVDLDLGDTGQLGASARQAQHGNAARLQFGRDGGAEAGCGR